MSQTDNTNPITTQPTTDQPVAQNNTQPVPATTPSALRACLNAIMPCLEVALAVGSAEAQNAIEARLENNSSLTADQKRVISTTVSTVIQNQGHITAKALKAKVDGVTTTKVLGDLEKDTAANIAKSSAALIEVGSQEAKDVIDARLANNTSLTQDQKDKIANSVAITIQNQGHATEKALHAIVDGATIHAVFVELAKDTASNAMASAQTFIDIGSEVAQAQLRTRLEGAFQDIDPALQKMMVDSIMQIAIKEGRLTEEMLNHSIESKLHLAKAVTDHISTNITAAATDSTHDSVNDDHAQAIGLEASSATEESAS
jgi:hypothetical protein